MQLKKINSDRPRLADEAYQQILSAIRSGTIGEEDRLVQERLATDLQISRTPIREALLRLEQDGILDGSPRGGFVIHRITDHEVKEIYQARAAIEGQAARILAVENNAEKIATLRDTIEQEENIPSKTLEAYIDANRNIHRMFLMQCENRYMLEMFDKLWNRGMAFYMFAAMEHIDISKSLGNHMELVDAVATTDPTKAMEAVIQHIHDGFDLQIEALAQAQQR